MSIFTQNESIFDPTGAPAESLLPLQVDPSSPAVEGLLRSTGMVLPDKPVPTRMSHFPDNLYDLRETSHLVRFCKALLGDSGAGQLRKQYAETQFQGVLQGTRFYDLDRFYGAIFGVDRFTTEALWINPYIGLATSNEWDEIVGRDAAYRARIMRLASSINLGATVPGLKAAAEALADADVDVTEVWNLMDMYGSGTAGSTWDGIEVLGTWDNIEDIDPAVGLPTWSQVQGGLSVGRTGTNSRAEVVIYPRKDYEGIERDYGVEEADRQRAEDELALIRVLSVIKPASVLITVDTQGAPVHEPAQISHMFSPSNYWEVSTLVAPRPDLIEPVGTTLYPLSARQRAAGVGRTQIRPAPLPAGATAHTPMWSYVPEVVSVRSYSIDANDSVIGGITDDTVTYRDGSSERFEASRALMGRHEALSAQYGAEGSLTSAIHPTTRVESVPHV